MSMYEAVKGDEGRYFVQALSPCWKPIICISEGSFSSKRQAEQAACKMIGLLPNAKYMERDEEKTGLQIYREELRRYKAQHGMK